LLELYSVGNAVFRQEVARTEIKFPEVALYTTNTQLLFWQTTRLVQLRDTPFPC